MARSLSQKGRKDTRPGSRAKGAGKRKNTPEQRPLTAPVVGARNTTPPRRGRQARTLEPSRLQLSRSRSQDYNKKKTPWPQMNRARSAGSAAATDSNQLPVTPRPLTPRGPRPQFTAPAACAQRKMSNQPEARVRAAQATNWASEVRAAPRAMATTTTRWATKRRREDVAQKDARTEQVRTVKPEEEEMIPLPDPDEGNDQAEEAQEPQSEQGQKQAQVNTQVKAVLTSADPRARMHCNKSLQTQKMYASNPRARGNQP